MDSLSRIKENWHKETLETIKVVREKRESAGYVSKDRYFINRLTDEIHLACGQFLSDNDLEISFIDRRRFGADIAIKSRSLLKSEGLSDYVKGVVPKIVSCLDNSTLKENGYIKKVESVNIYVNVLLADDFLLQSVEDAASLRLKYGQSDIYRSKNMVIDFSSPNIAKNLHPGHIRSTIIGEVLANIYESVGYTAHRLNYVNDWGGVGVFLEGLQRWGDFLPGEDGSHERSSFIYSLYRMSEKITADEDEFKKASPEERGLFLKYFGGGDDFLSARKEFDKFKNSSAERFNMLEQGSGEEVSQWMLIREGSLKEFSLFYDLIGIHHDYYLGEAFFADSGRKIIDELVENGGIKIFTEEDAISFESFLNQEVSVGRQTERQALRLIEEAKRDIGAFVIPLDRSRRMVVMRSDGASIYATRDLASLKYRVEVFGPDYLIYETGEEQSEYFKDFFEAAEKVGLIDKKKQRVAHVSHGLYISKDTGRKLSSREGAEGVMKLLNGSVAYFRGRYNGDDSSRHFVSSLSDKQKDINSLKLAVGSISYNDIAQDIKLPVSLSLDVAESVKMFEESGGAYIMYSVARAGSVLKKLDGISYGAPLNEDIFLDDKEVSIIKLVIEFPSIILRSAEENNPATLACFLKGLAIEYNGYYESHKVLDGGKLVSAVRAQITEAVFWTLKNGLRLCHADPPDTI